MMMKHLKYLVYVGLFLLALGTWTWMLTAIFMAVLDS
jgi:hypothetical protein|tara:strand:- start:1029 stop:1139 length:111 start_codon:yes stop_codon:yes gene_type:complete